MLRRALIVVFVGLLALPLAAATPTAEAGKQFKTVTRTFTNTGFISVPGAGTEGPGSIYPSSIVVRNLRKGKIKDVNVTLHNITHAFPADLEVLLVPTQLPGRQASILCDSGGGNPVADVTITLDDQAFAPLPTTLVSGTFRPGQQCDNLPVPAPPSNGNTFLNVFNNGNPNGEWQLWVADSSADDIGSIAGGWSLEIKAKVKIKDKKK